MVVANPHEVNADVGLASAGNPRVRGIAVADILPFKRKPRGDGNILCRNGHHRWTVWQRKPFDVKQGKLVTVYRCERCGAEKTEAK